MTFFSMGLRDWIPGQREKIENLGIDPVLCLEPTNGARERPERMHPEYLSVSSRELRGALA